jgi:signal-transduction protein with cAMP-binding, CBS, and nucleotidyltransferase domain
MSAEATIFEVTFYTAEVGLAAGAQTAIYEQIFRSLRLEGIALGAVNAGARPVGVDSPAMSDARRLVETTPVFAPAGADERQALASALQRKEYEPGETVLEQGAPVPALLVVGSGVLSLKRRSDERVDELERIGTGGCFGSRELANGAVAQGALTALTRSRVYRLDKPLFLNFMQAHEPDDEAGDAAKPTAAIAALPPQATAAGDGAREWFTRQIGRL